MTITVFLISRLILFYENYFTGICRLLFGKKSRISAARLTHPWNSVLDNSRRRRCREPYRGKCVTNVITLSRRVSPRNTRSRAPLLMSDYQSLEMISRSTRALSSRNEGRNIHEALRAADPVKVFYASRSTIHSTILCLSVIIINGISLSPALSTASFPRSTVTRHSSVSLADVKFLPDFRNSTLRVF